MLIQNDRNRILKIFNPFKNESNVDLFLDLVLAADELINDFTGKFELKKIKQSHYFDE